MPSGFLIDANKYVTVDQRVIESTLSWLLKQQQADGRWISHFYYWNNDNEQIRRSAQLTAYITHVISSSNVASHPEAKEADLPAQAARAVKKALPFVEPHAASIDEPYLIAAYSLAALGSGQDSRCLPPA